MGEKLVTNRTGQKIKNFYLRVYVVLINLIKF